MLGKRASYVTMNRYKQFCICQEWSVMVLQAPYTCLYRSRCGLTSTMNMKQYPWGYLLGNFVFSSPDTKLVKDNPQMLVAVFQYVRKLL